MTVPVSRQGSEHELAARTSHDGCRLRRERCGLTRESLRIHGSDARPLRRSPLLCGRLRCPAPPLRSISPLCAALAALQPSATGCSRLLSAALLLLRFSNLPRCPRAPPHARPSTRHSRVAVCARAVQRLPLLRVASSPLRVTPVHRRAACSRAARSPLAAAPLAPLAHCGAARLCAHH